MAMITLESIVYDESIYPRFNPNQAAIDDYLESIRMGDKFPLIILEAKTNKILDGYHRWKACQRFNEEVAKNGAPPIEEIEVEYHSVPDGITAKLYALWLNAKHGVRISDGEKKDVAREQYLASPGIAITEIAKYCNVSRDKASEYIKDLVAKFEETRNTIIQRLDLLGWTQQEIADKLQQMFPEAKGTGQWNVGQILVEMPDLAKSLKLELSKGHDVATVAKRHELPLQLVWTLKLDGKPDEERMEALDIKIQPYDVWHFQNCLDLFGNDYPGRIPGQIVAHVLYFYTQQGDVVLDPMAGSGTTNDVCLVMGRRCYSYDVENRCERPDVLRHNLLESEWPERIKKANLIFWDPPYFAKKDDSEEKDGYGEHSISKLPRTEYLAFFQKRLSEAKSLVKKGTRIAFLMSDFDNPDDPDEGIFIWHYTDLLRESGWMLRRHIQVPLSTQQVHPDIVNKFRQQRRLARLERYLLIAEA